MTTSYDRDLIGYGANPPDPKWPNGARIAINFVMNYEEGSEPSVQDGEGYTEIGLTEAIGLHRQAPSKAATSPPRACSSSAVRVGFWRHRCAPFQERGLPLTVFGCALAHRAQPKPAAEAIRAVGLRRLLPWLALDHATSS